MSKNKLVYPTENNKISCYSYAFLPANPFYSIGAPVFLVPSSSRKPEDNLTAGTIEVTVRTIVFCPLTAKQQSQKIRVILFIVLSYGF